MMRVGTIRVDSVIDGEAPGSCAAMYPDVSAETWSDNAHLAGADGESIIVTLGGYLVRSGPRVVLVDCGNGSDPVQPWASGAFRSSLLSLGVRPSDVTDVLFTHLHADHTGWATRDGRPFFPNAVYHCDRRDWDHFMAPGYEAAAWERRMTRPEDAASVRLAPVRDRMQFWTGDAEILPGIHAVDAAGHTPGTSVIVVESGPAQAALLGDVAHTVPELLHAWDFSAHLDHAAAVSSTRRTRDWLATAGIPCAAAHFPGLRWGHVHRTGNAFGWSPLES